MFIFGFVAGAEAQFLERLGKKAQKAAERTVERRVEREASKKTDEALDEVLDNDKKKSKNSKDKNSNTASSGPGSVTVNTAKDFERGNKIIFQEQFTKDAIGDFPVSWNTNASGEVVTFGNNNTRWLKMAKGFYMPDGVTHIPKNSTIEMDIHQEGVRGGTLYIKIGALKNKAPEIRRWENHNIDHNGVAMWLYPYAGEIQLWNKIDGTETIRSPKTKSKKFTDEKKTVHLSVWRQEKRIRVYLDDEKVLDIPRAFGDADYNSLIIYPGYDKNPFFVSNILITEAGADTRHKLLETGTFSTSDILFETAKATLQPSSFTIIDEIGEVLKSNPAKHLTIIGHTDSDGSAGSNQILSEQRAESVKNYLLYKHDISSSQVTTVGKGASQPVASGNSAQAKAKNRRVEFLLK